MIFATCGSTSVRFDRMMGALRCLPATDLYVQHGASLPPPCAEAYDFLPFGSMVALIDQTDIFISHAGVGSVLCALRAGHVPILFPRLKKYSEAVDDHQAELAEALAGRGTVRLAHTAEELLEAVHSLPPRGAARTLDAEQLVTAVQAAIMIDRPQRAGRTRGFAGLVGRR